MRKSLVGVACLCATVGVMSQLGAASAASAITTPPRDCSSSFNPYRYTRAAVDACGYRTFDPGPVRQLRGGGSSHEYDVDGTVVRILVPPSGFKPLTATNAQLDEYGLPPRPGDRGALQQWQAQMATWKGAAAVPAFLAETRARADSVTSPNWSGYAVTGGSGAFTHAESWYYEPTFYTSQCATSSEVTWAGIGGWGTTDPLGQDGTSYQVPGMANHQAWTEVWPLQNIVPVNFYGHAGYEFDASTRWLGNGYRFYMYDYYSATTYSADVYVSSSYYSGDSAEAIAERPKVNGSLTNLSNFGTMTFQTTRANGIGIDNWSSTAGRHGVHMVDSSGYEMATPSGLGSDGYFTDTQDRCY